jgi:hypothetical protein
MQIFISYSRVDKAFALRLADDLRRSGYGVWIDIQNIPHGVQWDREVEKGLETSDVMLVLLSPTSSASENVKDEWNYFIEKKRRIIPVMIQPNDVPFRLSRRQRVDFVSKTYEMAFPDLLKALEESSDREEERRSESVTRSIPLSWGWGYSFWNGLTQVQTGQAIFTQNDLRLLAPSKLPILIPLTSITGAKLKKLPFDQYIEVGFMDRAAQPQTLTLAGTEGATRAAQNAEFIALLSQATGKRFE